MEIMSQMFVEIELCPRSSPLQTNLPRLNGSACKVMKMLRDHTLSLSPNFSPFVYFSKFRGLDAKFFKVLFLLLLFSFLWRVSEYEIATSIRLFSVIFSFLSLLPIMYDSFPYLPSGDPPIGI